MTKSAAEFDWDFPSVALVEPQKLVAACDHWLRQQLLAQLWPAGLIFVETAVCDKLLAAGTIAADGLRLVQTATIQDLDKLQHAKLSGGSLLQSWLTVLFKDLLAHLTEACEEAEPSTTMVATWPQVYIEREAFEFRCRLWLHWCPRD